MSIASGFTKMKNYILTSSGYKLLSRWTSSQTVHMGDGTDDTDTVEYRFGAMKGITSSLATDNYEFALSASAGKNLQDQCTQLNQSLIPNYETTKTVLSDNSKASYNKKYVVNKNSWFVCDHQSYNGYSWGNVFVNEIRVAGFRAMPIDEAHYAYSSTTFFAPKGSTIIINGAGGMTVTVSEIG